MKKINLLLFAAILLTACQPAATPQPTAIPPTNPPIPSLTPAPVESLAGSIDEVVGVWWFTQAGIMLDIKADGTYRVYSDSTTFDEGNYTLDNGRITWDTGHPTCNDEPATYEIFIIKQADKPTWLRLQPVGSDPCLSRVNSVKGKAKFQAP